MLSHSFTNRELQKNQHKHTQIPPQNDLMYYRITPRKLSVIKIKQEGVLPDQKNDSHPILASFGRDHFWIRINDK